MGAIPLPAPGDVEAGRAVIRNIGHRPRMGQASAASYTFDPSTGLSNDPSLPGYMQDLTPSQLQMALNDEDPSASLLSLINQGITGTGAGSLPCGTPDNPTCGPAPSTGFGGFGSFPAWVWIAAVIAGTVLLENSVLGNRR
jgi:hypothetical protein